MRQKNKNPPKAKSVFAIIGDGACEYWYFSMLKNNERARLRIDLKPELPVKKKLKDQFEIVKELSKIYDKVFWILDFDIINAESRLDKSKLQKFKDYVEILQRRYKNVEVIINNPCLEFWFLLHFEETGKFFDNCDSARVQLIKWLPDYEKTEKYFKSQKDIYKKLEPQLKTAIANAKKLGAFDFENIRMGISEMYKFFDEVFPKR